LLAGAIGFLTELMKNTECLLIKRREIMKRLRRAVKPGSLFLAILMITVFTPYQTVLAKMISTETVIEVGRAHEARIYINSVLQRKGIICMVSIALLQAVVLYRKIAALPRNMRLPYFNLLPNPSVATSII
jgi:hypothetical protein